MTQDDALVGLRFEVSGGLGRMSGHILGKAGALYLVQKDGAPHFELLELDDLRSAKFYRGAVASNADNPGAPEPATAAAVQTAEPPRKRLAEHIRKRLGGEG